MHIMKDNNVHLIDTRKFTVSNLDTTMFVNLLSINGFLFENIFNNIFILFLQQDLIK